MLTRIRHLAVALIASAGALIFSSLIFSAPAGAVQTTTWGIVAAPTGSGGYRPSISHAADGSTVHDAVLVFNRTGQPITIRLSVLGASYANGAYQFGSAASGLASHTSLAATTVKLGPHEQARVPVTIVMPRGAKTTTLAAIAAEGAPVADGALSIQQRLVVFVKATPSTHVIPVVGHHPFLWGTLGALLLIAVIVFFERERRRNRSRRGSSFGVGPRPAAAAGA